MDDRRELLRVQEEWQRAQASLSWADKIRFAEAARESIAHLRVKPPLPSPAFPLTPDSLRFRP